MEARLLPLLSQHSLPIPKVNQAIGVSGEHLEIDFFWPRRRLCVETDGGAYHDNPVAQARDSHRNRILRAAGYEVRRLVWDDLEKRPGATMAELTRLLMPADPSAVPLPAHAPQRNSGTGEVINRSES